MQVKSVGADGSNPLSSLCRLRLVDLERLYGTTLSDSVGLSAHQCVVTLFYVSYHSRIVCSSDSLVSQRKQKRVLCNPLINEQYFSLIVTGHSRPDSKSV